MWYAVIMNTIENVYNDIGYSEMADDAERV